MVAEGMLVHARSASPTFTRKLAATALGVSSESNVWHVTTVTPTGNVEPDAGLQSTAATFASSSTIVGGV